MPSSRYVQDFAEIEAEFMGRVQAMVWCNLATLDAQQRLRSRVVHPLWEGASGWVTSRRASPKAGHITRHSFVSLAYIANVAKPLYVECAAAWADDAASKQHIWQLAPTLPPPLGFDLTPIFQTVDNPNFGLLRLVPWRIVLSDPMGETLIWQPG